MGISVSFFLSLPEFRSGLREFIFSYTLRVFIILRTFLCKPPSRNFFENKEVVQLVLCVMITMIMYMFGAHFC